MAETHVASQQSPPSYEHAALLFDESQKPSPIQFGVPAQDAEQSPFSFFCKTPHDVDAHGVYSNA